MWRLLGNVLPRSIREGIYEPAYLDLWRSVTVGKGRQSRWQAALTRLRLAGYLMTAVWYAMPAYLGGWGRTPRVRWVTRIAMVVVTFGALAVLFLPRIMTQLGYYGR